MSTLSSVGVVGLGATARGVIPATRRGARARVAARPVASTRAGETSSSVAWAHRGSPSCRRRVNSGARGDAVGLGVEGATIVDCAGKEITPGWIDPHTHYDAQVMWDPMVTPSADNGVTVCKNSPLLPPSAPLATRTVRDGGHNGRARSPAPTPALPSRSERRWI